MDAVPDVTDRVAGRDAGGGRGRDIGDDDVHGPAQKAVFRVLGWV
jgi:hypothetical protein